MVLDFAGPCLILIAQIVLVLLFDHCAPFVDNSVFLDGVVPLMVVIQVLNIGFFLLEWLFDPVCVEFQRVRLGKFKQAVSTYIVVHFCAPEINLILNPKLNKINF